MKVKLEETKKCIMYDSVVKMQHMNALEMKAVNLTIQLNLVDSKSSGPRQILHITEASNTFFPFFGTKMY